MPYVYQITNNVNNKSYVGYTSRDNVEARIIEHFSPSIYNTEGRRKRPLYAAIKKYGKDSFTWKILYEGDDALEREKDFIAEFGDYNLHEGGNVPPSQKGKTWKLSEETKQKMRKPKAPRTEAHNKAQSESKKGQIPWNKGLTKDDERVKKYTEARMKTMGYK